MGIIDGSPVREYDYTMLSKFLSCRRKYQYRIVRGLVPPVPSPAPEFGRCMHLAMDSWYEHKDVARAQNIFGSNFDTALSDDKRNTAVANKIIELYHEQYKDQPHRTLAIEKTFRIPIGDNLFYVGRMDKVVEWDDAVWAKDHKTTARLNRDFFNSAEPNTQLEGYAWALFRLGYKKVAGSIVDAILVAKGLLTAAARAKLTPLARYPVYINEAKIRIFESRIGSIIKDIEACDDFYQNTDQCCMWNTTCPYRKLCLADDEGFREAIIKEDFVVSPWEPLKHESTKTLSKNGGQDEQTKSA